MGAFGAGLYQSTQRPNSAFGNFLSRPQADQSGGWMETLNQNMPRPGDVQGSMLPLGGQISLRNRMMGQGRQLFGGLGDAGSSAMSGLGQLGSMFMGMLGNGQIQPKPYDPNDDLGVE